MRLVPAWFIVWVVGIQSVPGFAANTFSVVGPPVPAPTATAGAPKTAQAQVPAAQPTLGLPQEDVLKEAIDDEKKTAAAAEALNSINPASGSFSLNNLIGAPGGGPLPANITRLLGLLKHPIGIFAMNLLSKEEFTKIVNDFFDHPNKRNLLYSQIGLLVLLVLFRAWRSSRIKGFFRRLWMGMWTTVVYMALASYVLPVFWLGDTYTRMVQMVYSAGKEAWSASQNKAE